MTPLVKSIVNGIGNILRHEYGENQVLPMSTNIRYMIQGTHSHDEVDNILESVNVLLKGYGVEVIRGPHVDQYYMDINLLYVNLGDTYIPTLIYDTLKETFVICSWGDYVEKYPKRFTE